MACLEPYIRKDEDPTAVLTLDSVIAEGSFGIVYKGRHTSSQEILAIKIIKLEEDETFDDLVIEIDVLSKCSHPNIVGYFGSWKRNDELFIAMELCDGGSAADVYQELGQPYQEPIIALICREFIKGLGYLHAMGIIHRDIKGANILLTKEGKVKLVDFGVSGKLTAAQPTRKTFIGTPYWMAPEVIENKGSPVPYNTRADIWSVGITMLEFAHGEPPLSDMHPMRALFQIPYRKPPTLNKPSDWSPQFPDIVARCLERDPRNRPDVPAILEHPFFLHCADPTALGELVQRYVTVKKANETAEETAAPEGATPEEDKAAAFLQELDNAPKLVTKAPSPAPSPSPAPLSASSPETPPAIPPVASSPSLSSTSRPATSAKTRPSTVHRTAAKRTLAIKQKINRKFIKQQIQEIKKLQRNHQKEMETLEAKQGADRQKLLRNFQNTLEKEQKKFQQEEEKLQHRSQLEKDDETKHLKNEKEEFLRQQQNRFRNFQRDMMNWHRLQKRDFDVCMGNKERDMREVHKTLEKEEEKRLRAAGEYVSKKYMKQLQIENQAVFLQHRASCVLLFTQQQQMQRLCDEHREQLLYKDEFLHKSMEHHAIAQHSEEETVSQTEERELTALEAEQKFVLDFTVNLQKFEKESQEAVFALQREQLRGRQLLETQQHKRQQELEGKELFKEFKLEEKKKKAEFDAESRDKLKHADSGSRKIVRDTLAKDKASFQQTLTTAEKDFTAQQRQREAEEDHSLLEGQQEQTKQQLASQAAERAELAKKHEDALAKIHQMHYDKKETVINQLCEKRREAQSKCHGEQIMTITQLRAERREQFLLKFLQEQKKILKEHQVAAVQQLTEQQHTHLEIVKQKHQCAIFAKEKDQRKRKQPVDTAALAKQHSLDIEAIRNRHQEELYTQNELHVQQETTMQETHQRMLEEDINDTIAYGEALTRAQGDKDAELKQKLEALRERLKRT
ncbi:STE/STE20/MST protein kinase [Pelomyxa schiedti]|nr:STE/STE20/MST protein kinase [Pelomyxa schiedti]